MCNAKDVRRISSTQRAYSPDKSLHTIPQALAMHAFQLPWLAWVCSGGGHRMKNEVRDPSGESTFSDQNAPSKGTGSQPDVQDHSERALSPRSKLPMRKSGWSECRHLEIHCHPVLATAAAISKSFPRKWPSLICLPSTAKTRTMFCIDVPPLH